VGQGLRCEADLQQGAPACWDVAWGWGGQWPVLRLSPRGQLNKCRLSAANPERERPSLNWLFRLVLLCASLPRAFAYCPCPLSVALQLIHEAIRERRCSDNCTVMLCLVGEQDGSGNGNGGGSASAGT